jgi:hypothetical protein
VVTASAESGSARKAEIEAKGARGERWTGDERREWWEEHSIDVVTRAEKAMRDGDFVAGLSEMLGLIAGISSKNALRAEALEDRLAALEHRDAAGFLRYSGVYQRAHAYVKGEVVTCDGSLWVALADIPEMIAPGGDAKWQLAVAKGKDGKSTVGR